jgi:hypothetical protein
MARPFGATAAVACWRKIVKPSLSWSATACRSGTSNSTVSPSVSRYQLRDCFRSVTGTVRWSNFIMLG